MIRDATTQPGWISLAVSERDGAYAMDTLRFWADRNDAPDLSETERMLIARQDPLCDLAVATFGRHAFSVSTVYQRAPSPAHRLAALANSYCLASGWAGSILDEDEARILLSTGNVDEVRAFFANPRLSPDGLLDVLYMRGPASVLDAEHKAWPEIFHGLASNSSLGDLFDTRMVMPSSSARFQMNGALRNCLRKIDPTLELGAAIADCLVTLLDERAPGTYFPAEDLPQLVLTWHPSVATDASSHPFFKIQMLVSILYSYPEEDARAHSFPAVRAAAMAQTQLDSEMDLDDLLAVDKAAFFAGMPYHRDIYEDPSLGSRFVSLAASGSDTALGLYLQRQAKLDDMWGLDRPASVRDIKNLRSLLLKRPVSPMSEHDIERLRQIMAPSSKHRVNIDNEQQNLDDAPWWKYWILAVMVALAVLLIFRLMEADAIDHAKTALG